MALFGKKSNAEDIGAADPVGEMLLTRPADRPVIGEEDVRRAAQILKDYKAGKANLEERVIEDEKWYQVQHNRILQSKAGKDPNPTSAWLFNTISNKHADAMDNYPKPNVLPREQGDIDAAKSLSCVIPCILEQNDFEEVYSANWWEKLKHGTGVYFVGWDSEKEGGLGDADISVIDLLNIYWEPGITNIQDSRNLFIVGLRHNDELEAEYPQLREANYQNVIEPGKYIFEDEVDTTKQSLVVDWYYHARNAAGQRVLHMVKFVGNTVLYATQNNPETRDTGLYDHGEYPVEFDTLFPQKGSPVGFGYIAITRNPQLYIDELGGNILKHSKMATTPRYWCSKSAGVNKEQFLDWGEPIVDVEGQISADRLQPITVPNLDGTAVTVMQLKIDELKETSSSRDVNSGATGGGVTSAAGITALQEAGNKTSRDSIKASYRCYTRIDYKLIELVRQFYDEARTFRITGEMAGGGEYGFMSFSNSGIKDQVTGLDSSGAETYRRPVFDIKIVAEKKNPFSQMTQNEYAKEFYQMGLFNPERAQESVIALSMMDFEGKDKVLQQVQQGQTLLNICKQQAQELAMMKAVLGMGTAEDGTQEFGQASGGSTGQTMGKKAIDAQRQNMTGYQEKMAKRARPDMSEATDAVGIGQ